MRSITPGKLALLQSGVFSVYWNFTVENGSGTPIDLSERIIRGKYRHPSPERSVATAELVLSREENWDPTTSLAPLSGASLLNRLDDGTTFSTLLKQGRNFALSAAIVSRNSSRPANLNDYDEIIRGKLARTAWPNEWGEVTVNLYDQAGIFQRTWTRNASLYTAGTPVEHVMQGILDDEFGAGVHTVHYDALSGHVTTDDYQPDSLVWEALTELAGKTGGVIWYEYNAFNEPELTYFIPDRNKSTSDYTHSIAREIENLEIDDDFIRTIVQGIAYDATTGAEIVEEVEDPVKTAEFGGIERFMRLVEPPGSFINTSAGLLAYINAALSDTKDPDAFMRIRVPFFHIGEVSRDLYTFPPVQRFYDDPQQFAPFAIESDIIGGGQAGDTYISVRGKPTASAKVWVDRSLPKGEKGDKGDQGEPGAPGDSSRRVIMETFQELPEGIYNPSAVLDSTGCSILAVSGTAGGTVMRVIAAARYWAPGIDRSLPFDQNTLYKVQVRVRVPTDNTTPPNDLFYAGLRCVDVNGNHVDDHYVAANAKVITDAMGWVTYKGYVKGYGSPFHEAWNPLAPSPVETGTAYISPLLIVNWNTPAEMRTEVDYFLIEAVDEEFPNAVTSELESEITDVETSVTNLETYMQGAFADSLLSAAEAEGLFQKMREFNTQKAELDFEYNVLIGIADLTGTAETNLIAAKTDYNSKHTTLINTINSAIADSVITTTERTNISNALSNYNSSLATLRQRAEQAVDSIKNQGDLTVYRPKIRVVAVRTGSLVEVTVQVWDPKLRVTAIEYRIREGNGSLDATWQTSWVGDNPNVGTPGVHATLFRQHEVAIDEGVDSEFHWLVRYTNYDGAGIYEGDTFGLNRLEESVKELTFPFSILNPDTHTTTFSTTGGELRPGGSSAPSSFNGGVAFPVGVELTKIGVNGWRANAGSSLVVTLHRKEPSGATPTLASVTADVDATAYLTKEDTCSEVVAGHYSYFFAATLNPSASSSDVRLVWMRVEYITPSYVMTY